MRDPSSILPESTLAELATAWAGASRVFQRHDLDFCCQGKRTLAEACRDRRLPIGEVLAELRTELLAIEPDANWIGRPQAQLIAHLVDHCHRGHREELPRLLGMASKVEQVHGDNPDCPVGLADHLRALASELEQHMQQEERILFPMLLAGAELAAAAPIHCLSVEHDEHGRRLATTRAMTHDFEPPATACSTWRALYLGLHEFERSVMEHIHLENHVLFPWALRQGAEKPS